MDPNANIREQRDLTAAIVDIQDNCSDVGEYTEEQELELVYLGTRLAELVQALDMWITGGGALPKLWQR